MKFWQRIIVAAPVLALVAACSTSDTGTDAEANVGRYYAVSAKQTPFYHYGPQQGNGPDQKLAQDTLMTLIRPSFGYSKVKLMTGEQGYVASEDIHVASRALIAAATAPPPPPNATSTVQKFRLDSNDPRLIAPPEALPIDLPEPTPLPGTDSSPPP
ncbi:MAG: hypothetical protein JO354_03555 [Verrucomicrobia bacterium]|nr:hypothetical protein [Verrucomicrobiota bacterium]